MERDVKPLTLMDVIVPAAVALPELTSVMATELAVMPATVDDWVAAAVDVTVTAVVAAPPATVTAPFVWVVLTALDAVWVTLTVVPPLTVIAPAEPRRRWRG